jgi:glucose/arabinose dehydrogenase
MASRDPSRRHPDRDRRLRTLLAAAVAVAGVVLAAVAVTRPDPNAVFHGPTALPSRAAPVAPSGSVPGSGAVSSGVAGSAAPSGSPGRGGAPFDPRRVAVTAEAFVAGLDAPLAIVNAGDGSGRLFVAEQGGLVRIIRDGRLLTAPFLDVSDRIASGGERGLLGLAFHPRFPDDPRVFVDYTDRNGDTHVSSFRFVAGGGDRVDPASERQILFVKQPFANHNGGALAFDPAGKLLISLGDGGSGGDPQGNGQSLTTLLGKILRIDIDDPGDGTRSYGIPPDNPFAGGGGGRRPEIWLTGLRNPWRMSVDRATGDLWIGDVGQNAWEEIDVQRAGAPGGTNFGWNRMEGTHCFQPARGCEDAALTLPVSDYGHDLGCTVIGGVVDRDTAPSPLNGGYLFGDYCSGRLWAIDAAAPGYQEPVQVGALSGSLSAFGEDEAGAVYAADIGGGRVLRVSATAR